LTKFVEERELGGGDPTATLGDDPDRLLRGLRGVGDAGGRVWGEEEEVYFSLAAETTTTFEVLGISGGGG
jgi:hypothetical protein